MSTFGSITTEYKSDVYDDVNILKNIGVINFDIMAMQPKKQAKYKVIILGNT